MKIFIEKYDGLNNNFAVFKNDYEMGEIYKHSDGEWVFESDCEPLTASDLSLIIEELDKCKEGFYNDVI